MHPRRPTGRGLPARAYPAGVRATICDAGPRDGLHLAATDTFGPRNQSAAPEEALTVLRAIETPRLVSVPIRVV